MVSFTSRVEIGVRCCGSRRQPRQATTIYVDPILAEGAESPSFNALLLSAAVVCYLLRDVIEAGPLIAQEVHFLLRVRFDWNRVRREACAHVSCASEPDPRSCFVWEWHEVTKRFSTRCRESWIRAFCKRCSQVLEILRSHTTFSRCMLS